MLKKYINVTVEDRPLVIVSGKLKDLDENQIKRRTHQLSKEGNAYNIIKPVTFKAGETFQYLGESISKTYYIEEIEKEKAAELKKLKSDASSRKESNKKEGKDPDAFDSKKVLEGTPEEVEDRIKTGDYTQEQLESIKAEELAGGNRDDVILAVMVKLEDMATAEEMKRNTEFLNCSVKDITAKLQTGKFTKESIMVLIATETGDQNRAGAISILNNKLESIKQSE